MDIDLDVLNEITATAVKAAGMRDYTLSPLVKRHVRPDGTIVDTELAPPPKGNQLYDLAACVAVYEASKSDVYVGEESISILHDGTRTTGYSSCCLRPSETIVYIGRYANAGLTPEEFEKMAKLYFGADSQFMDRIRKLQWKTSSEATTKLSSVAKSADIQEIAKVVDDEYVLFQDVTLLVTTPYFVLPVETAPVEIELHIVANAETKKIAFAPAPGVMMKHHFEAMQEVRDALNAAIGEDVAVLGRPNM